MILVVDDDTLLAGALAVAFEKEGYRVQIANDGGEAYRYVKDPSCKLLILDMHMPHVNGAELLILMANEEIRVPTIAISSFRDFTSDELKGFSGVVAFLQKPFEISELVKVAKKHVPKKTRERKRKRLAGKENR
ncbi:response regulator transcription factor [bacterium]|nr:response regulator transcription factor [bacterium]